MAIDLRIDDIDGGDWIFDPDKLEFVSDVVRIKPTEPVISQTFNQSFTSSTGFTFDVAKTQFTGSQVEAIDQRPTDATFYINFTMGPNANWADGILTGTLDGAAFIDGGFVKMTNTTGDDIHWAALDNADSQTFGCVRFTYVPQYNSSPSSRQIIWFASKTGALNNCIAIEHISGGNLSLILFDENAVDHTTVLGSWSASNGVEFEFELNWDFTTGATRLFIDGTQFGATVTDIYIRSSDIGDMASGDFPTQNEQPNFWVGNILVFSTVQHTSDYTAPSTQPEATVFLEDLITIPVFTYTGLGSIQEFTDFVTTEAGTPQYIMNDFYWDGAAWAVSDGSRSQSNPKAIILANISSLPVSDSMVIKTRTTTGNVLDSIDDLTLEYTGSKYWTDSPTSETKAVFNMDQMLAFGDEKNLVGNDSLTWTLSINGVGQYWNGSAWAMADGSPAQSNAASVVNDNVATFPVEGGKQVQFKSFITSATGTTTPEGIALTCSYNFSIDFSDPIKCLVFGFVLNMSGEPVNEANVRAYKTVGFQDGDNLIVQESNVKTDETGYWQLELVETVSALTTMNFQFTFVEQGKFNIEDVLGKTIPAIEECAFNELP